MSASTIRFTAKEVEPRDGCKGCIFEPEHSRVCHEAVIIAKALDLPDCEYPSKTGQRVIYVRDKISDPRQIRIRTTEQEVAA